MAEQHKLFSAHEISSEEAVNHWNKSRQGIRELLCRR